MTCRSLGRLWPWARAARWSGTAAGAVGPGAAEGLQVEGPFQSNGPVDVSILVAVSAAEATIADQGASPLVARVRSFQRA